MKNKFLSQIIIILFVALWIYLPAQEGNLYFEKITVKDGLSQSTVYTMLQDHKGFFWFGTQDRGLNKYDGYEFSVYFNNPNDSTSVSSNKISKIIQSGKGLIYLGTWGGGLCVFDPVFETFKTYRNDPNDKHSLSHDKAQSLFEDENGMIWVGTSSGGLNKFDPETEKFIAFMPDPGDSKSINHERIWDINQDQNGFLWLATENGLCRFDPIKETAKQYLPDPNNPKSIEHKQVRTVFIDNSGTIWAGTAVSLDRLDVSNNTFEHFYFPFEKIQKNSVNRIFEDSKGNFWVGTHIGGLVLFDPETGNFKQYTHDPDDDMTLGYNDIRDLYEDHSGILWIATRGGGINKLNLHPKKFRSIQNNPEDDNSLSNNRVKSIIEDKKGNLWIGTDVGGGLDKYDRNADIFTHYYHDPNNSNSLISNDISALCEDHQGNIWIGTDGYGISVFNPENSTFKNYENDPNNPTSLCNNEVWVIFQDTAQRIWIGTNNGLDLFDPEINGFIHYVNEKTDSTSLSDDCVWTIYQDKSETLWFGTDNGLSKYNEEKDKFTQYKNNPNDSCSLAYNTIFSIYEDHEGIMWIGTSNGISLFNRDLEKFKCYKRSHDLVGNAIYGILEDDNNNLWVSTVNGMSKFNKSTLKFRSFDTYDGLENNDYSIGAYTKSYTGEFIFGGVNGVTIFYPDSITNNNYIPPIAITEFLIYNQPVTLKDGKNLEKNINYASRIMLSPEDNVISFQFAALDYTNPQKNQYKYFLENFDKEWNHSKTRRFANYTNIPSGKYVLHVKGSNNDNVWNEEGISIEIVKKPPFYETIWFYALEGIAFVLLILLFFRLRLRSLKKDKKILEQKVKDRTREIDLQKKKLEKAYFDVQQSAKSKEIFLANTSHEIRTPLNVIIGYTNLLMNSIQNSKLSSYIKNIKSASNNLLVIINDILDFSKIEAGKLSVERVEFDIRDQLDDLISIIQIKVNEKELFFEYEIDDKVPDYLVGDPYRLNQILSNLLDNAVKFTHKKGKVKLRISVGYIDKKDCELVFKVSDTGIGIPAIKMDQIFESFTQASADTTRKFGGTGLGLSIVKSLIDLQRGKIDVESEEDKGTTFTFYINYKIGSGKNIIKKDQDYKISRAQNIKQIKILLVEDNPVNLALAVDTIQLYNDKIEIEVAENGKIAIEKLTENSFDLVIMDVQMPVMDGYEATKHIRNHMPDEKKYIPILGMTAHALKEEREKCIALGMNDYLTKPFIPEELFQKIESLIGDIISNQPARPESENASTASKDEGDLIDLSTLHKIYGNESDKIKKILSLFQQNIPEQLEDLSQSAALKNWNNVKIVAHSLKTSFNYLNLDELRQLSMEIEKAINVDNNISGIPKKIERILSLWKESQILLQNTIERT